MPSTSPAQARLMAGAAHNPAFAKKVGVPQSVAQEYNKADAGTGILRKAMNDGVKTQSQSQQRR